MVYGLLLDRINMGSDNSPIIVEQERPVAVCPEPAEARIAPSDRATSCTSDTSESLGR